MVADVVSLDEARLRLRGEPPPEAAAGSEDDVPRHISDEDVLAGEL